MAADKASSSTARIVGRRSRRQAWSMAARVAGSVRPRSRPQRFETAMRALPERQRQHSVLPLLHYWQEPQKPLCGALASTERFRAAVQEAKVGPDKDIPHVTAELIVKYITDLQLLGLL